MQKSKAVDWFLKNQSRNKDGPKVKNNNNNKKKDDDYAFRERRALNSFLLN